MKLRSVTSVVTNSSSEVFCMKASDYEAVVQNHPELEVKGIKVYHDISELAQDYQAHPYSNAWPFRNMPPLTRALLLDYKLSDTVRKILRDFGHTDQEIDTYENAKSTERIQVRNESKFLQEFIKIARGIWYDYYRGPQNLPELREYLDNCGIEYTWDLD